MNIYASNITRALTQFLSRFHLILFVTLVAGSMVIGMFVLNSIVNQSSNASDYDPNASNNTPFDQAVISKLKTLRRSTDEPTTLSTSGGRTNPFTE